MLDVDQQLQRGAAMRREAQRLLAHDKADEAIVALRAATRAYTEDDPVCAAGLAESLGELSAALRDAGHPSEALEPAEQALRVVAKLAARDPTAHLALLIQLTDNLGRCCQRLQKYERAAAAFEQAVGGYRILAEFEPDAHGLELVDEMSRHGLALAQSGQLESAYAVADDYVARGRELLPRSLPLVTGGLMFMADVAGELGRTDDRVGHLGDGVRLLDDAAHNALPGAAAARTRMLAALREAASEANVDLPPDLAGLV